MSGQRPGWRPGWNCRKAAGSATSRARQPLTRRGGGGARRRGRRRVAALQRGPPKSQQPRRPRGPRAAVPQRGPPRSQQPRRTRGSLVTALRRGPQRKQHPHPRPRRGCAARGGCNERGAPPQSPEGQRRGCGRARTRPRPSRRRDTSCRGGRWSTARPSRDHPRGREQRSRPRRRGPSQLHSPHHSSAGARSRGQPLLTTRKAAPQLLRAARKLKEQREHSHIEALDRRLAQRIIVRLGGCQHSLLLRAQASARHSTRPAHVPPCGRGRLPVVRALRKRSASRGGVGGVLFCTSCE